jgi:putative mRNA 3-end processing factor
MGKTVNHLVLGQPQYLRAEKPLRKALHRVKTVHSEFGRRRALKGDVIVTTSGMLDGGPVLWYLMHLKNDKRSGVLLTGYQVDESNGRRLLNTGMLDFYGVLEKIECEVCFFDFSAHAGHRELLRFIEHCDPEKVVVYHSENPRALAEGLGDRELVLPAVGKWFEV